MFWAISWLYVVIFYYVTHTVLGIQLIFILMQPQSRLGISRDTPFYT